MLSAIRGARSLLAVLLVALLFLVASLPLRLVVIPGARLFPRFRFLVVSVFMKGMAHGIFGLLGLGGARFRRRGTLPTATPVVIVANHQSLTDILQVALLAQPRVPAYVTRSRYKRFVPLVSACMRLLGCPIVDPERDAAGAIEAVRRGARELPHGLLIFPESHRSIDGAIRPFRLAGLEAILRERRAPVYLVVNDGAWRVRRLADLLFRAHLIDARSEAEGPLDPPEDDGRLPEFIAGLRTRLVDRLAEMRSEPASPAA